MKKNKVGKILYLLTHIIIFSSLFSTYQIIFPHLEINWPNYIITSFIIPLFTILTIISYERAVFTEPGPITIKRIPLKLQATNPDLYGKSCRKCDNWKPPRAHHCSRCDKCVFKMDHHCEWINNCNGSHNQKYFILFLFYNIILTILIGYIHIIGCVSWSLRIRKNLIYTIFTFTAKKMIVVSIFLLCGFFIIFISSMLFDQVEALKDNQTVVESHKGECGRPQQISFTMKQVFGQNKWLWFLPIKSQILLNYAELVYSPDYTLKEESMYIEDCIYDSQSEVYQHFTEFQVDNFHKKQEKDKNQ